MLEKEYNYFKRIRSQLVKDHLSEFVVITGEKVLGFYNSIDEAIQATSADHELGSFIIQECIPEGAEINRYHSRVVLTECR